MTNATTLPEGYTLRRPTMDDTHALFEVECACQMAQYGELDMVEEDMRSDLRNQHLAEDMWVVRARTGRSWRSVGVHPSEYGRMFTQIRVHPDASRAGHRRGALGADRGAR